MEGNLVTQTNAARRDGQSIEIVLGRVLQVGTLVSAAVIAVGGLAWLVTSGGQAPHYDVFRGEPSDLSTVRGIVAAAFALEPQAVIQLGLLLLVGTPIARVVGALAAFSARRDGLYVAVSSLVLAALLYSLLAS
jgi:uncharacterized membrane protein